jgi:hypothetical protein
MITDLFLKAKHWQLFLLLFGIPMAFEIYIMFTIMSDEWDPFRNPESASNPFLFFPIMMLFMLGTFFGWFWSIGVGLQPKLPKEIKMNAAFFKWSVWIPFGYTTALSLWAGILVTNVFNTSRRGYGPGPIMASGGILLILHLFAMFCIFYDMYFAAKTLKSVELQREAKFSDFAGEFFLIWFFPIGIWIIQPRVNQLK